jgi:hypothetical protein
MNVTRARVTPSPPGVGQGKEAATRKSTRTRKVVELEPESVKPVSKRVKKETGPGPAQAPPLTAQAVRSAPHIIPIQEAPEALAAGYPDDLVDAALGGGGLFGDSPVPVDRSNSPVYGFDSPVSLDEGPPFITSPMPLVADMANFWDSTRPGD